MILGRTPKYVAPALAGLTLVAAAAAAGQAASTVAPAWPATTVVVNSARTVTGTADKSATRVVLQQRVAGSWRSVAAATPASDGRFSVNVPTWWMGTRDYRVVTDADQISAPTTFKVNPRYTPRGRSSEHNYMVPGVSARWDPCKTIGWRINSRQATSGALEDTKRAFRRLGQATGFTFRYRGTTSVIPQMDSNSSFPADTQIVVAWARKGQSSLFDYSGPADAVANPYFLTGYHNGDGAEAYKIVSGGLVIDSTLRVKAGFGSGITRGDLLLHELGHVMGLAHYESSAEMMNPIMTRGEAKYGKGDLAALEARGAKLGCLFEGGSGRTAKLMARPVH